MDKAEFKEYFSGTLDELDPSSYSIDFGKVHDEITFAYNTGTNTVGNDIRVILKSNNLSFDKKINLLNELMSSLPQLQERNYDFDLKIEIKFREEQ